MGYPRNDEFHLAGFGTNIKCGAEVLLGNHFYVRGEAKCGYINMPDIRTTMDKADKAHQHFEYAQINTVFGYRLLIPTKKQTAEIKPVN